MDFLGDLIGMRIKRSNEIRKKFQKCVNKAIRLLKFMD